MACEFREGADAGTPCVKEGWRLTVVASVRLGVAKLQGRNVQRATCAHSSCSHSHRLARRLGTSMRHCRVSDSNFCTSSSGQGTIADVEPDEINRVAQTGGEGLSFEKSGWRIEASAGPGMTSSGCPQRSGPAYRTPKSESRSSIAAAKPEQSNRAIFFFPSILTGSTRFSALQRLSPSPVPRYCASCGTGP